MELGIRERGAAGVLRPMGISQLGLGYIKCLALLVSAVLFMTATCDARLVTGFAPCPQTNPPAAECIVSLLVDLRPFRLKGSKAAPLPQSASTSISGGVGVAGTLSPPTTARTAVVATTSAPVAAPAPAPVRPSITNEEEQQLLHQQRRYEMQLREQQRHQQQLERQLHQQGEELRFLKEQVRQLLQLLGTKAALDVPQRADEVIWERSRS